MKLGMISPYINLEPDHFNKIAENGLSFVEFCVNVGEDIQTFADCLEQIAPELETNGLTVGSIGRWGPDRLSSDGTLNTEELQNERRLLQLCAQYGCPVYVTGCNRVESISLYANAGRAIEYLGALAAYGKELGVTVAVYNCHWNNFINSRPMWELVLGHLDDLAIKYDASHSVAAGQDYLAEIRDWGHRFAHMHIKGTLVLNGKHVDDPPAGLDQIDWKSLFALLYYCGYDGTLSLEPHSRTWSGALGEKGVAYSIRYIKQLIL